MKVILWILLLITAMSCSSTAQRSSSGDKTYDVIVHFQSMCCGVPDEKPLNIAIKDFIKKHKTKPVYADRIGPLGREGEYSLAFELTGMSQTNKLRFQQMVQDIIPVLKDPGQAICELNNRILTAELPAGVHIEKQKWD